MLLQKTGAMVAIQGTYLALPKQGSHQHADTAIWVLIMMNGRCIAIPFMVACMRQKTLRWIGASLLRREITEFRPALTVICRKGITTHSNSERSIALWVCSKLTVVHLSTRQREMHG